MFFVFCLFLSSLVCFFLWLPEEELTLLFLLHCENGDFSILMKDIQSAACIFWDQNNSKSDKEFGCLFQIGNNAYFCEALGEYLPEKREQLDHKKLQALANKVSLLSMLSHKPSSWMTCCNCKSFFVLSFSIYCFLKHGISASSPGLLAMYMLAIVSQLANVMDLELQASVSHRNISLFFGMPM